MSIYTWLYIYIYIVYIYISYIYIYRIYIYINTLYIYILCIHCACKFLLHTHTLSLSLSKIVIHLLGTCWVLKHPTVVGSGTLSLAAVKQIKGGSIMGESSTATKALNHPKHILSWFHEIFEPYFFSSLLVTTPPWPTSAPSCYVYGIKPVPSPVVHINIINIINSCWCISYSIRWSPFQYGSVSKPCTPGEHQNSW